MHATENNKNVGEPDFETAVKGIAQGVTGKLKEVAGELLDDSELEESGITQQLEGKLRRAGAEVGLPPQDEADPTE